MSDTEQADTGAAALVQVITATRNLKTQPFIPGDDPIVKRKAWDDWLEEIEREFMPPENSRHKRRVKRTTGEGDADHSTSSDDEFFCQAVRRLKQVKKIKIDGEDRTVLLKIEDVGVGAERDSGAVNDMDEHQTKHRRTGPV